MNKALRRCGVLSAAASVVAACGGNASDGYSRVVSFGDSLSADLVLAALVARGWL